MKSKIFYIKGMHCVSCEKLLDDEFRNIKDVKDVKVDRRTNTAEIYYDGQVPDFGEIKNVAKKFGYEASENGLMKEAPAPQEKKFFNWQEWLWALFVVVGLWVIFRIFQNLGYLDAIDLQGGKITFGISILVGLVASVSSCLVVVGAVIIAFGEKYRSEGGSFFESAVKPNLFFHVGRLITFFALGGALGAIGGELNISGNFVSVFTIIIAIVMAWLGLNILGFLPSISNLGIKMPGVFTSKWSNLKNSEHKLAPFVLGGMSFFLPCGFTQSMQIFALTSGSFWTGGLTLFLFALGTVPSLMLLGITASWTKHKRMGVFQKVAGILIVIFAFYTLQSGLALSGVKANVITTRKDSASTSSNKSNNQKPVPENNDGSGQQAGNGQEQTVVMHVTSAGFEPATLKIKKGIPVKWVIKGDQVTSCTSTIIIPSLNISKRIGSGDNIIRFTPDQAGTIPYSCGMGMVRGKFLVE